MNKIVVDASIVIKWLISEEGTSSALEYRSRPLVAPDLLFAERANILWKKHDATLPAQAELAARALASLNIDVVPTHALIEKATKLSIELDHPATALERNCPFVTADERLSRTLPQPLRERLILLGR